MGKGIKTLFWVCAGVVIIGVLLFSSKYFSAFLNTNKQIFNQKADGIAKVMKRGALESEARKLAEAGELDKAIGFYQQAIQPELINEEHEKSTAIGAMEAIYKWQRKYEKALEMTRWFLRHPKPTAGALERKQEILALITYRDFGDKKLVYDYIKSLKESYQKWLPPVAYNDYSSILISNILRLYDTIGDYDAGIKFIDECLAYFKTQDIKKYGEYRPGRADAEYLKIRKAFEAEKKAGGPTCKNKPVPAGSACIGDATKALIQSSEFPW